MSLVSINNDIVYKSYLNLNVILGSKHLFSSKYVEHSIIQLAALVEGNKTQ
jgi:hypothetical protein